MGRRSLPAVGAEAVGRRVVLVRGSATALRSLAVRRRGVGGPAVGVRRLRLLELRGVHRTSPAGRRRGLLAGRPGSAHGAAVDGGGRVARPRRSRGRQRGFGFSPGHGVPGGRGGSGSLAGRSVFAPSSRGSRSGGSGVGAGGGGWVLREALPGVCGSPPRAGRGVDHAEGLSRRARPAHTTSMSQREVGRVFSSRLNLSHHRIFRFQKAENGVSSDE